MAKEIEKARQQIAEQKYKRAVTTLWTVEAQARATPEVAHQLLELAEAVRDKSDGRTRRDCEQLIEYAQSYVNRAAQVAADPASGAVAVVASCRFIGGSGIALDQPGEGRWDLIFRPDDIALRRHRPNPQIVRLEWEGMQIQIAGAGAIQRGGGFVGGGFGVGGAAEGMLIASALNAITTRRSIDTVVHIEFPAGELFLHHDQETPQALRRRLSAVFTKLRQASLGDTQTPVPSPSGHIIDRLEKLGSLFERGLLTETEFAKLKSELLSDAGSAE